MTDEAEVPEEEVDITSLRPMSAPYEYATQFQLLATGIDLTIVFQRPQPAVGPKGVSNAALVHNAACVAMSHQAAKNLQVVLTEFIETIEKEYGLIETDFTRKRAETVAPSKKGKK